jgi:hypothetical protein
MISQFLFKKIHAYLLHTFSLKESQISSISRHSRFVGTFVTLKNKRKPKALESDGLNEETVILSPPRDRSGGKEAKAESDYVEEERRIKKLGEFDGNLQNLEVFRTKGKRTQPTSVSREYKQCITKFVLFFCFFSLLNGILVFTILDSSKLSC